LFEPLVFFEVPVKNVVWFVMPISVPAEPLNPGRLVSQLPVSEQDL
jgi:hypothetical protein